MCILEKKAHNSNEKYTKTCTRASSSLPHDPKAHCHLVKEGGGGSLRDILLRSWAQDSMQVLGDTKGDGVQWGVKVLCQTI